MQAPLQQQVYNDWLGLQMVWYKKTITILHVKAEILKDWNYNIRCYTVNSDLCGFHFPFLWNAEHILGWREGKSWKWNMGKVNAWFKGCQVYWIFLEDIAIKLNLQYISSLWWLRSICPSRCPAGSCSKHIECLLHLKAFLSSPYFVVPWHSRSFHEPLTLTLIISILMPLIT